MEVRNNVVEGDGERTWWNRCDVCQRFKLKDTTFGTTPRGTHFWKITKSRGT